MTSTATTAPTVRNGVPIDKLFATIGKLKDNGELAKFRFTARNRWIEGTGSQSTIHEWFGAGADQLHVREFNYSADHPTLGNGHGPSPQEFVLHALAACITAGVATTAAARKIDLTSIDSTVQGDIDVRGVLGIDAAVRNGFNQIRLSITVDGDASPEDLAKLVEASKARSAVLDMLTDPTSVSVEFCG